MKRTQATALILVALTLLLAWHPARAQTPPNLTQLQVSLWPEYDDPRLLVIINGALSEAGQTIRIPIPGDNATQINAVATADESGQLVNAEYTTSTDEAGNTILTFTPQTSFHVEYYTPVSTNADQRIFDFALPPGYFTASDATLELVLPPDSTAVSTDPELEGAGTGAGGGLLFGRAITELGSTDGIEQSISYSNPTGALTVPEDARITPAANPTPNPAPGNSTPPAARNNTLLVVLAVVGVALVIGGIIGIWRTRRPTPSAAPPPTDAPRTQQAPPPVSERDRFCRSCGTPFNADDRFCRNCGAARK